MTGTEFRLCPNHVCLMETEFVGQLFNLIVSWILWFFYNIFLDDNPKLIYKLVNDTKLAWAIRWGRRINSIIIDRYLHRRELNKNSTVGEILRIASEEIKKKKINQSSKTYILAYLGPYVSQVLLFVCVQSVLVFVIVIKKKFGIKFIFSKNWSVFFTK